MSAKVSAELKAIETRRNDLQARRKILNTEINDKQRESASMNQKIKELQTLSEALRAKTPDQIIITEHAMLRYLQRAEDLDIDALQKRILTEKTKEIIDQLGTCKINIPDSDIVLVVKDRNIVTVDKVRDRSQPKKPKRYKEVLDE